MKHILKSIVVTILTFEARLVLKRHKPKIVAITGNVGKTSSKDAIYTAIKNYVPTRKNQKSYNSEIGVPLTVLGLQNEWSSIGGWVKNLVEGLFVVVFSRDYPEVLVLEAGVDRPGDMKRLTTWMKPDIVVLTRLPDVPVHVEYFRTPEAVVEEKMQLVKALKVDGVLVYNNDDEIINHELEDVRQKTVGYGRYAPTDFTASKDGIVKDGSVPIGRNFTVTHADNKEICTLVGTLGLQHMYAALAAIAVAYQFGVSLKDATIALKDHITPPGRMRLLPGKNDELIIDDTYNSSPTASEQAVMALKEVTRAKRKIAVLGDMLELGQYSVTEHEALGAQVAPVVNILCTIGVRSRKIAEAALEHGLSEKHIFQYDSVDRAAKEIAAMTKKGDVILVKASQSIRAEKVVVALAHPDVDISTNVVRQETEWQRR